MRGITVVESNKEPLWKQLDKKWKARKDEISLATTGMTDEENQIQKIKEYHNRPDYIPTWKERGFSSEEEYWKALREQDNSYDEKIEHLENGIVQGVISGGRKSERADVAYYGDDLQKGYDY